GLAFFSVDGCFLATAFLSSVRRQTHPKLPGMANWSTPTSNEYRGAEQVDSSRYSIDAAAKRLGPPICSAWGRSRRPLGGSETCFHDFTRRRRRIFHQ